MMDIQTIRKAKNLIKEYEGLRLKAYYCSANVKTIGWGHVIGKGDNIDDNITEAKAEALLDQDIADAASCLFRNSMGCDLNSNQRAALISFIFNLGGGAFQSSTLRQKLLRGEYIKVADEFKRWVYAGGKRLNGLDRRREAEAALFATPVKRKVIYPSLSILSKIKSYIFGHAKA